MLSTKVALLVAVLSVFAALEEFPGRAVHAASADGSAPDLDDFSAANDDGSDLDDDVDDAKFAEEERIYGVPFFRASSFERFASFSLHNYQKIIVFCGFFPHESQWGASADPKRSDQPVTDELQEAVEEADDRMKREIAEGRAFQARAGEENSDVRFVYTSSASYSVAGGSDLTSLFTDEIKCHVFNRRTMSDLTAPQATLKMDEFSQDNEELWKTIRGFYDAPPNDPYAAYSPGGDDGSTEERSKFLIDYSMIDRAAIEEEWPELKEPMCFGAAECEIPRVRNISNREFMLRYYIWGRPVIIEDAMADWNLVGHWTEEYLVDNIKALKKRRRQSGESQLLNVLDKDDQAFLRKDYDIPYFLDFGDRGNATLDTELLFFGEMGAKGLDKHIDTGCHQYWVHIQGTKQWEMWPIEDAEYAAGEGDRGWVRPKEWHFPKLTATVKAGEILVFYSGWWHKTNYIEPEVPTLSFTMYLHRPVPKLYVDQYRHSLLTRPEYKMCMKKWFAPELIVGGRIDAMKKMEERAAKMLKSRSRAEWKAAKESFLAADGDGDGRLSQDEWSGDASAFAAADENGDGYVDLEERKAAFLVAFSAKVDAEKCAETGECPAQEEEDATLAEEKEKAAKAAEAVNAVPEEECESRTTRRRILWTCAWISMCCEKRRARRKSSTRACAAASFRWQKRRR